VIVWPRRGIEIDFVDPAGHESADDPAVWPRMGVEIDSVDPARHESADDAAVA
jgi:hypothetical protein